jgi:hypothetical protein
VSNQSAEDKIKDLINACAPLEPLALIESGLLTELEEVAKTVEPTYCDGIAEIFFEMCTSRDEGGRKKIDYFQQVLILSIVEKMDFPESRQAEGFHYWADKCSCELVELGYSFCDEDDEEIFQTTLSLIKDGTISEFAQIGFMHSTGNLEFTQLKTVLLGIKNPLVWMGLLSNFSYCDPTEISWIVEHLPNFDADDFISLIEESHISSISWQYPFVQFSREDQVTDQVIKYLINVLEEGYKPKNDNEKKLIKHFIDWEDDHGIEFDLFIQRVQEICQEDSVLVASASNSCVPAVSASIE